MPVSYSETVEVSVDTYERRSGSKLTLTAEVASATVKGWQKKPAAFVITDTATGGELSIAATTDANGIDDYGMDSSHPGRIHHPRGCDRGWRLRGLQLRKHR